MCNYQRLLVIVSSMLLNLVPLQMMAQNNPAINSQYHLQQIDYKMRVLQQQLRKKKQNSTQLQQELKKMEARYAIVTQQLQQTNQQRIDHQNRLLSLQNQVNANQHSLTTQQTQLANQLRMTYMLKDQPPLKFLFAQNKQLTSSQMLNYFHYLTLYQTNSIKKLKEQINAMHQDTQSLKQDYLVLQTIENKQHHEQQELITLEQNHAALITQTNEIIHDKSQQLQQLIRDRYQLEKTIDQLPVISTPRETTKKSTTPAHAIPFASLQRRLPWPTPGKIIERFGTPIDQSELRWDGVLINTKLNQGVYAVADGQVVFSKWLSGYGLLIIINHGQGYITLYGYNHTLYKKTGNSVHAGELIASVGESDDHAKPTLYFGIRHNTQPLNPVNWCQ